MNTTGPSDRPPPKKYQKIEIEPLIFFTILNKITTHGSKQTKESGGESDSDYFTADEADIVEEQEEGRVDGWWDVKDFYQFQCRDGTVWWLPRYYDPETDFFLS